MTLTSNLFLLFTLACLVVYYIVPGKCKWMVLLAFSYLYYISGGVKFVLYLLFSTAVTFTAAYVIQRLYDAGETSKKARTVLVLALLANLGVLGVLKYTNFFVDTINMFFHTGTHRVNFLMPLGLSFYTFQSTGYVLDVYWKREKADKNFFQYALFVSFFPQLMQGPISRHDKLAHQLVEPHYFEWTRILRGAERMLWGLFKKMVIADWAVVFSDAIFDSLELYPGTAFFGCVMYIIELYADFSGAMDIVIGLSEMFGITLEENFRRPFFSKSMDEYWRRWHMTLGSWMKDYAFYPVALSGWMSRFGKWGRKKFGKKIGRTLPIVLGDILIFLLVGIWHGPEGKYIFYGLYNGIIIGFSELMKYKYKEWKGALHIKGTEKWYVVFMILRTWMLTWIRMFYDRAATVKQGTAMLVDALRHFNPSNLLLIPAGREGTAFTPYALIIIACGVILLFIVGVLQERGMKIRESIAKLPMPVAAAIYFALLLAIGLFGSTAAAKGFIYAQF